MPKVFLTAVWGFDPDKWAALGFTRPGDRDSLLRQYRLGDFVALFGTMGTETAEADRGNLLGLVQLTPKAIETRHLVHPDLWAQKLADQGARKWIAGLPMSQAWLFDVSSDRTVRTLLPRMASKKYHRTLASRFELLDNDEAELVLALAKTKIETIYMSEAMAVQEARASALAASKGRRNGPPPSFVESLRKTEESPASVYALRFEGDLKMALGKLPHEIGNKSLFKIGWSVDADQRCKQINAYMPDEAIMGWKPATDPLHCISRVEAYAKEQRILLALGKYRLKGEMVLCSENELRRAWNDNRISNFSSEELLSLKNEMADSMIEKL